MHRICSTSKDKFEDRDTFYSDIIDQISQFFLRLESYSAISRSIVTSDALQSM